MLTLFTCLIFFLSGFVQGLTGFGGALVAIPLLSFFLELEIAVPLMLMNGLIITFYMAFKLRKSISIKKVLPMVIGSIPGTYFGFKFLINVNPGILTTIIGLLIVVYGVYNLLPTSTKYIVKDIWGYPVGLLSGGLGAALSIGGPPVIVYMTMKAWDRDEIKSTLTGFFCFSTTASVLMHATGGTITIPVLKLLMINSPFVIFGVTLGLFLGDKINRLTYFRIINVFLIIIGIKLLLNAIW